MKKLILVIAAASIWMIIILPTNIRAADITAGATTWYTWWNMDQPSGDSPKFDPAFLYGPALSVKFNDDFNMTFVFLYGKFDMTENRSEGTSTSKITRTDSDLALNYRLNNYLKIFVGGKYMGYTMKNQFDHSGYGPGAGISAVIPAGGDFFILGNISGLYLWGKETDESESNNNPDKKYNEYGANTSLSLAYYIESASTTISLGGRYQIFKTKYEDQTDGTNSTGGKTTHQFYGVTLSANYSFSI